MDIFWWIGFSSVIYFAYILVIFIYERMIRPPTDYSKFAGEWALITGSSYGLGEELAYSLAKRGLNVVLVARSKEKLEKIAAHISATYKQEVKVIVTDFTAHLNVYEKIEFETRDLNISILVNNVGGPGYEEPFPTYLQTSLKEEEKTHNMNAIPMMRLTRLFLPKMLERKKKVVFLILDHFPVGTPISMQFMPVINLKLILLQKHYSQNIKIVV